ncbi:coiled-coil domain-containing protein 91 [Protopterus annectens]|uniref:coiled-coil domain-containing protein 91 n=1 Tax=Protopterus annectens TaxID=7888 RepID=UPI001CF96340|nr:coiled-coil domain-containing protein 91 [Protopterus annectens]
MDDDDFGGFEAAETFENGEMGAEVVSPTIPWAAFPGVVPIPQSISPDFLLEQSSVATGVVTENMPCISEDNPATVIASVSAECPMEDHVIIQNQVQNLSLQLPVDTSVVSLSSCEEKHSANEDKTLVTTVEQPIESESEQQLKQALRSLEDKLSASENEKFQITKDLEDMLIKHSKLEDDFIKEKEEAASTHHDHYSHLQEKHMQELEEMRKAGHEALSIIVEEFKALTKSAVLQQQEASEKHLVAAVARQSQKCEELLCAQHQRLLDMLDQEKKALEEQIKGALVEQTQHHKEELEKCITEERQRNSEAMKKAIKLEKEKIKEAISKAVEEQKENMLKHYEEQEKLQKLELSRDQERASLVVQQALQDERRKSQEAIKLAVAEEQRKCEIAIEEAVKKAREELMDYIKEQKRAEHVIRQRNLSSLELFLSCAQQQLSALMEDRPVTTENKK